MVAKQQSRYESFDDDQLILVDELDREIGHMRKAACHAGAGVLHRAFSLLIFNERHELLLQRAVRRSNCGRSSGRTAVAAIRATARA
jgi:hypothetical protein